MPSLPHVPEYTLSLMFFVLPICLMLAYFARHRLLRAPQKRALIINIAVLSSVGFILDLVFAKTFFTFPDPEQTLGIQLRGIPIEEFLFYITGFWFIVLLYAWCDEHFLRRYNRPDFHYAKYARRLRRRLYLEFSLKNALLILSFIGCAWLLKSYLNPADGTPPGYLAFLTVGAYAPYMLFWRITRKFINFQALAVTVTVTTLISVIWEVTLAIPRGYWGYRQEPMLGIFFPAWHGLPAEAVTVWVFSSLIVLTYEYSKIAVFRLSHRP